MQINIHINESNPGAQQPESLTQTPVSLVAPEAGGTAPALHADDTMEASSTLPTAHGEDAGGAQIAHILEAMPEVMERNGDTFENAGSAPQID